jgi:hypothetical protein
MDGAVIRTAYLACLSREKVRPSTHGSINHQSFLIPLEDCRSDNHHRDGSRDNAVCGLPALLVPGICSPFKSCGGIPHGVCGAGHQFRRIYPCWRGDEDAGLQCGGSGVITRSRAHHFSNRSLPFLIQCCMRFISAHWRKLCCSCSSLGIFTIYTIRNALKRQGFACSLFLSRHAQGSSQSIYTCFEIEHFWF